MINHLNVSLVQWREYGAEMNFFPRIIYVTAILKKKLQLGIILKEKDFQIFCLTVFKIIGVILRKNLYFRVLTKKKVLSVFFLNYIVLEKYKLIQSILCSYCHFHTFIEIQNITEFSQKIFFPEFYNFRNI